MPNGVKSAVLFASLNACAVALCPASVRAEPTREPPLLFGGPPPAKREPIQTDPWLPTGARSTSELERPKDGEPPGCSFSAPVCVHRGAASGAAARRALAALDNAYSRIVRVLGLTPPASDQGRGGSDALDLYLEKGVAPLRVGVEPIASAAFDRASGFCVVGGDVPDSLDRSASLCVAESVALALAPAAPPHLRRAFAEHLWLRTGAPTSSDVEAIDFFQAHPERSVAYRDLDERSAGAALLFEYLDFARGTGPPGALATSLFAAAATRTETQSWLWDDSPDVFDVLRHTLGDRTRDVAMMFVDFSVARAFIGERSDGAHLPELGWLGWFGRPRFDWSIDAKSLPRRVLVNPPIEPLGSVYLWFDLGGLENGADVGFQAAWEPPVSFQWTLVKVDRDGQELGRIPAPFVERGTEVEQHLVDLDGAAGVLIVGTNLGGIDLAHPFDPDYAPFEPHGCTVYLSKL